MSKTYHSPSIARLPSGFYSLHLLRQTVLLLVLSAYAATAASANSSDDNDVIESFAVASDGNFLIVPVKFNQRSHLFLVDTGSPVTYFDNSLKESLQPTGKMVQYDQDSQIEQYHQRGATIGESRLEFDREVYCIDMHQMRTYSRRDLRGVVGMDILRKVKLRCDLQKGELSLLRSTQNAAGIKYRIAYNRNKLPTIAIHTPVAGKIDFMIDTGCVGRDYGILTGDVIDTLFARKSIQIAKGAFLDRQYRGESEPRAGHLSEQWLGTTRLEQPAYAEGEINALGLGFLLRFRATIDFPDSTVYLKPNDRADDVVPVNESGIQLLEIGDQLEVFRLEKSGLGARAGLRVGDRLLKIDGIPVKELHVLAISQFLRNPAANIKIVIRSKSGAERIVRLSDSREMESTAQ